MPESPVKKGMTGCASIRVSHSLDRLNLEIDGSMAFAVMGLGAEGIEILNPGCCKKTFENFFEVLDGLLNKQ